MIHSVQSEPRQRRRPGISAKSEASDDITKSSSVRQPKKRTGTVRQTVKPAEKAAVSPVAKSTGKRRVGGPARKQIVSKEMQIPQPNEIEESPVEELVKKPVEESVIVPKMIENDEQYAIWKCSCPLSHVKLTGKFAKLSINDDFHELDDDIIFNQDVMQMFSEEDRGDLVPSVIRDCVAVENTAVESAPMPTIEPTKVAEVIKEPVVDETEDEEFSMI